MSSNYKIVVQNSAPSINILRYLDSVIHRVNRNGYMFTIQVIRKHEDAIISKQKKITQLPTLVAPNDVLITGVSRIKKVIVKLMTAGDSTSRTTRRQQAPPPTTNLEDFYMNALYDVEDNGRLKAKSGSDDPEDGFETMVASQMDLYRRKRPAQDVAPPELANTTHNMRPPTVDIAEEDDYRPINYSNASAESNNTTLDDMMMSAWMENNTSSEDNPQP